MRTTIIFTGIIILALNTTHIAKNSNNEDSRTFELRTYTAAPGKAEALHTRFRNHTNELFDKHGMEIVGYWIPEGKPDMLIYLLAHENRHAATVSWESFRTDPTWISAKKSSELNGALTAVVKSIFLSATDYSPMK